MIDTHMGALGTVEEVECSFQLWRFGSVDFSTACVLVRPWYFGSFAEGRTPMGVPHEVEERGGRCQDDISDLIFNVISPRQTGIQTQEKAN